MLHNKYVFTIQVKGIVTRKPDASEKEMSVDTLTHLDWHMKNNKSVTSTITVKKQSTNCVKTFIKGIINRW